MEKAIKMDALLCKTCKVCVSICPNSVFAESNGQVVVNDERKGICIACGQCMAACTTKAISVEGLDYDRDFFEFSDSTESSGGFNHLIQSRRSVRSFRDKAVPVEMLEQIADAIRYAPPAFPPIKTELTMVSDPELIKRAFPLMITLYDKLMKGLGSPIGRFIIKKKINPEKLRVLQNHVIPMFKLKMPFMKEGTEDAITRNAPALILFHMDKDSDNPESDIFIALTYGLLKAHELGLGATAIDLIPPAINRTQELRKMFSIPENNEVKAAMILGFPKFHYKRGIKRELKSVSWV